MKKPKIYFLMYDECIVHGGFFDTFEYYYLIKKEFKECDVKWKCITSHSKDDIIAILDDKYHDIESEIYTDIEVVRHTTHKFYRDPLVVDILICPTNSAMYWFIKHENIQAAKYYIGLADWKDIHPKQNIYYKKHLVLADERVFNYKNSCNWKPYRKKILFDKFKKKDYSSGKYDYMLNLSLIERRFSKKWIMDLLKHFGYGESSFCAYTGHKNKEYYSYFKDLDNVNLIIPPVEDFMGLFKEFIYIPYKDGTDATPRLIPECVFYNKKIHYYDKDVKMRSGGYYRFKDTKENFEGLWLKNNDEIISYIRNYLNDC